MQSCIVDFWKIGIKSVPEMSTFALLKCAIMSSWTIEGISARSSFLYVFMERYHERLCKRLIFISAVAEMQGQFHEAQACGL